VIGKAGKQVPKAFLGLPVLRSYVSTSVPGDFHALFSPPVILVHPGPARRADL
jgi:hypothetical protein